MHYPDSRSHRLQGYDYSQPGWYFVTLSTQNMSCLFGHVRNGIINLTDAGAMIERVWQELTVYSSRIDLDIFQVMPNHFYGILIIRADLEQVPIIPMDAGHGDPAKQQHARLNCRKHAGHGDPAQQLHPMGAGHGDPAKQLLPTDAGHGDPAKQQHARLNCRKPEEEGREVSLSILDLIARFKSLTTTQYIRGVKESNWKRFNKRLWGAKFHDHVIRTESALQSIRAYIQNNPRKWELDRLNK